MTGLNKRQRCVKSTTPTEGYIERNDHQFAGAVKPTAYSIMEFHLTLLACNLSSQRLRFIEHPTRFLATVKKAEQYDLGVKACTGACRLLLRVPFINDQNQ